MNPKTPARLRLAALALLAVSTAWSQSTDTTTKPANGSPATTKPGGSSDSPAASTTAGAEASAPKPADDTITLTPFEVSTEKDRGYYASNTLAGTRIASKVEDLGASITVITKQQLQDTAAIDINDIFRYEANTEGLFDFTPTLSNALTNDQGQANPAGANRIRGLTAANVAFDNFVHTARISIDTYNVGSVEIARGPNSTLFGLGSPSGTVNSNLNVANLTREITSVSLRADSYGGLRSTIDLNRPLLKDKLAIRIDAAYTDNEFPQKPSYDLSKRLYAALTYQPFKYTTIKLNAESYHDNRQTPNTLTPRDGVSEWIADGKPTWNPLTYTAYLNGVSLGQTTVANEANSPTATAAGLPAGLYSNTQFYTRPSMFISGGQVQLWEITRLDTTTNPNQGSTSNERLISSGSQIIRGLVNGGLLYNVPGVSNKALYDWTSINAVSTNWNSDKAAMYEAVFEQRIIENLYFRAGWRLEDSDSLNRNITNPPTLSIDVNQYLLDGQSNPYFLRPYIWAFEPTITRNPEYNDNLQSMLTYEVDFSKYNGFLKWLGHHRMLGYYESRRITDGTYRFREAISDPNHVWETAGALNYTNGPSINRATYRYYVGPTGALGYVDGYQPPKSGVAGTFNFDWNNAVTGQWVSDPSVFGTVPYLASQTRQEITSRGVVLQSDFFKDSIVYTGGLRKDFTRSRNSNTSAINANTGFYDYGALDIWGAWTSASGFTRTSSVVVKPLSWFGLPTWFGLSADKSSSFSPQPQAVDVSGNVLPNTYGHGQDVGFFIKTPDDKAVLSLKFYKIQITNDRNTDTTLPSRIATLEDGTAGGQGFSLINFANANAAARGFVSGTPEYALAAASLLNLPAGLGSAINSLLPIRSINDTAGNGAELEFSYNPTPNWNIKFSGAETVTKNTNLAEGIQEYIDARMPYWLSVKNDAGQFWWTTSGSGTTPQAYYTTNVGAVLKLDQALLGKSNPQVKKYSWRAITKYRFTQGWIKGFEAGGTAAWNDKSVIGYLAAAPDPDGLIRSLDASKGVYDPARYSFDFFTTYKFKMFGRIGTAIQLNLQNAFEKGGLRATAVNPDGSVYNWRIINPRKLILQTTFDF